MNSWLHRRTLFFVFILVLVALTIWLATIDIEGPLKDFVLSYGYAGLFVAAFIGGLNLVIPISHLVFIVPLLNVGLDPWLIIIIGALGTALADSVGYIIGRTGDLAFPKALRKFRDWGEEFISNKPKRAPFILLAWAAFVPLPNEFLVIPAGVLRFGFAKTLLITFLGNLIFNIIIVQLGGFFVMG